MTLKGLSCKEVKRIHLNRIPSIAPTLIIRVFPSDNSQSSHMCGIEIKSIPTFFCNGGRFLAINNLSASEK